MAMPYFCDSSPSDRKPRGKLWSRLSGLFKTRSYTTNNANEDTTSVIISSGHPVKKEAIIVPKLGRQRKQLPSRLPTSRQEEDNSEISHYLSQFTEVILVPPFSNTYCQPNTFPYSNFYIRLPDGRWMVRFRDGNRGILRTDVIDGALV